MKLLSRKTLIAFGIVGSVLALCSFIFTQTAVKIFDLSREGFAAISLLPIVSLFVATGFFLLAYLKPDVDKGSDDLLRDTTDSKVDYRERFEESLDVSKEEAVEEEEDAEVSTFHLALPQPAPDFGSRDLREKKIGSLFNTTQSRLRREIDALGRRSSLNLVVGVLITTAATVLLVYLVTREHGSFASLKDVLAYYIPRITTVALIETFAYFFLGLYKANLAEIKYYQNERTTVIALEIAWRASLVPELSKSTENVIQQIVQTDRNPVHVGISKEGAPDQNDILEVVKALSKLVAESIKSKEK